MLYNVHTLLIVLRTIFKVLYNLLFVNFAVFYDIYLHNYVLLYILYILERASIAIVHKYKYLLEVL